MGGVKVVNEYANRLTERGHEVTLVYPLDVRTGNLIYSLRKKISSLLDRFQNVSDNLYYSPKPEVNVLIVRRIVSKYIPAGDAVIAVGWQTADAVSKIPSEHGSKFYLLQSFETYFSQKTRILATYHLPLEKIAISGWIISEINKIGERCLGPLGNAINREEFFIETPPPERTNDVLMIYHPHKIKGAGDGIAVLKMLKSKIPDLKAVIITPRQPVHHIPAWVEVIIRPPVAELRHLYNSSKVFLNTSHLEGWGMTVMEALACGCAVVATKNLGMQEYLTNSQDAFLYPISDINGLTTNILRLLEDGILRQTLTTNGLRTIQKYSWDNIIVNLEKMLMGI